MQLYYARLGRLGKLTTTLLGITLNSDNHMGLVVEPLGFFSLATSNTILPLSQVHLNQQQLLQHKFR